MTNRLTVTTLLAMLCQLCSLQLRAQVSCFMPVPEFPFVYICDDKEAALPDISDSLFNASAQGIGFRVNRSELRADEPFIQLYQRQIAPMLRDKGLVLRRIIVRGAASPEGPYENNRRLSRERTQRLMQFIGEKLDAHFDASRIEQSSICEDYEYLVVLMQRARDAEAEAVARIWQQSGGDERRCKSLLRSLNGGRTWRRLLREYFPRLRQARVMLFFGRMPEVTSQTLLPELPATDILAHAAFRPLPGAEDVAFALPWTERDYPLLPIFCVKDSIPARLPVVALRTNLVHDFFYMPNFGFAPSGNVQLEFFPRRGHLTYNLGFTFGNHRHYADCKFFQLRDLQLEVRRYFRKGHPFRGAYLAAYAHGFVYGIGFGPKKGWEGEGLGAGLSGGYTLSLTRNGHFRMEFMAAVGYLATKYDPYVWGHPITGEIDGKYYYDYQGVASRFQKRNRLFTWLGPTNLGLQLTYDIIYRRGAKKGGRL